MTVCINWEKRSRRRNIAWRIENIWGARSGPTWRGAHQRGRRTLLLSPKVCFRVFFRLGRKGAEIISRLTRAEIGLKVLRKKVIFWQNESESTERTKFIDILCIWRISGEPLYFIFAVGNALIYRSHNQLLCSRLFNTLLVMFFDDDVLTFHKAVIIRHGRSILQPTKEA